MEIVIGKVEERNLADDFILLPMEVATQFINKVNSRPVFGEYDPTIDDLDRLKTINMDNASHRVEAARIEDGLLKARIRFLGTSMGKAAAGNDASIGAGIRGTATYDGIGKILREIITVDIVPTTDKNLMATYELPQDFMHTTVEVHDYEEYCQVRRLYHLLGGEAWPWHKGYKELTAEDHSDGIKHHLYGWEECGFLKRAGMCESGPGTFKSSDEFHHAVKAMLAKLGKI